MSIASGIGNRAYIGSTDLSGNMTQLTSLQVVRNQFDVTTIGDLAMRRVNLTRHGLVNWRSLFDDNNNSGVSVHDSLAALPTTDTVVSYLFGSTAGSVGFSQIGKQISHGMPRSADGSLAVEVSTVANGYGVEDVVALTAAPATSTGTEALAGVDNSAGTAEGLAAYLHVLAFTGTSVDVVVQHSSDNGAGDAYTDLATFTTVSGVGSQRVAVAAGTTVERWLRVDLDGTYTNLEFVVTVHRNETATG